VIGLFPKSDVTAEVGCASIGLQTALQIKQEAKLSLGLPTVLPQQLRGSHDYLIVHMPFLNPIGGPLEPSLYF